MDTALPSWTRSRRVCAALLRCACVSLLLLSGLIGQFLPTVHAQAFFGATLTVLRGSAAVQRADGTPLSPATSGLTLSAGDQVATLNRSSVLVTFFEGSELELGADTTIILRDLAKDG